MKDFNKGKPIIGIVGDTLEQAEWFARNLGGKLIDFSGNHYIYETDKMVFVCRRYGYKGATPRWDGIIFACDKCVDNEKTEDWLNSVR